MSFLENLREVLRGHTDKEVETFFETQFEKPLQHNLLHDQNTPAETIRQQLKQTEKIKTFFLTLRKK